MDIQSATINIETSPIDMNHAYWVAADVNRASTGDFHSRNVWRLTVPPIDSPHISFPNIHKIDEDEIEPLVFWSTFKREYEMRQEEDDSYVSEKIDEFLRGIKTNE